MSYGEQLIHVQAKQELGHIDAAIMDEPFQVQATLLDYAGDRELVLKAWIALARYRETTREILLLYGSEPEFREILRSHGDAIIPVIQYFRENDVWTVRAMDATGKTVQSLMEAARKLWDRVTGNGQANSVPAALPGPVGLGARERGWYAVNFIRHEGHDFLGQFAVNKNGKAVWNQTDRIVKASTSFFTSGVRNLETRHDLGEDITTADVFWAGLDVALVALPARLLVSGKALARSGRELSLTTRTRLFAPRLLSRGPMFRKFGAYSAAAATVYIVATHPSLLNSVLAEMANLMGVSPWIVQAAGWSLVIGLLAYLFSWLLAPVATILLFLRQRLEGSQKPA